VDILNLTVEKIPHNIEAAAAAVVGSNHPTQSTSFIHLVKYGIIVLSVFLEVVVGLIQQKYENSIFY
jgi:hypothetical protein